jgi:hypothetical protein
MTGDDPTAPKRSYGCTFGCGNPYDYIMISVADGQTEFLCMPCFVKLANDMVGALLDPDDPAIAEAILLANLERGEQAPGPSGAARGKNAPATSEDSDLFDAYDSRITAADLPEEFK